MNITSIRKLLLILYTFAILNSFSQTLDITTIDKSKVVVKILDSLSKSQFLANYNGLQDNSLRKKWTARTFKLNDGRVLVEFFDKNCALIDNIEQFKKLEEVRFVKNTIWNLKKNISYKIDLSFEDGCKIIKVDKPKRLKNLKSEMPKYNDYEVYQLNSGQILFINLFQNCKSAAIYPDLKTLSSENNSIEEQVYNFDDEYLMKKLASGDPLFDYDPREHLIYPKYENDIIKNHKLTLIESKIFVAPHFYGNLYKSENSYFILLDDFNQLNLNKTKKIEIGFLRVYNDINELRVDQKKYEELISKGEISQHFYQKLSEKYGQNFPEMINQLIDSLPELLNFDKEQLSLDSLGIDLIDETLKWNISNYKLFGSWFPSILAYYGQAYIADKKEGKWTMLYEKKDKVWIPEVILNDGYSAWDWRIFYKDLMESPIPLRWVGDWDRAKRKR